MAAHQRESQPARPIHEVGEPLDVLQHSRVSNALELMRRRYAKRVVPIEDVRAMLDEALGNRSLTEELYRMRGCME